MAIARVQVTIPYDSGIPQDVAVNTWHFDTGVLPTNATIGELIRVNVATFYNEDTSTGVAVQDYLSTVLTSPAQVKMYDLSDPEPRVPFFNGTFGLTFAAQGAMPDEVAVALSYQADPVSGIPQRRLRGRIFIGPLNADAVQVGAGGFVRPDLDVLDVFRRAGGRLIRDSEADSVPWVIYSPTRNAANPVTNGWTDNALDTIRSRGPAATLRTLFDASSPA